MRFVGASGGKERLGGTTKAGDTYLSRMLFVGAMAVIRHAERHGTRRPWLVKLLSRRHPRFAGIALANKIGRIAWALMTSGERYREPAAASPGSANQEVGKSRQLAAATTPTHGHTNRGKTPYAR